MQNIPTNSNMDNFVTKRKDLANSNEVTTIYFDSEEMQYRLNELTKLKSQLPEQTKVPKNSFNKKNCGIKVNKTQKNIVPANIYFVYIYWTVLILLWLGCYGIAIYLKYGLFFIFISFSLGFFFCTTREEASDPESKLFISE